VRILEHWRLPFSIGAAVLLLLSVVPGRLETDGADVRATFLRLCSRDVLTSAVAERQVAAATCSQASLKAAYFSVVVIVGLGRNTRAGEHSVNSSAFRPIWSGGAESPTKTLSQADCTALQVAAARAAVEHSPSITIV